MKITNKILALILLALTNNLLYADPAGNILEKYKKNNIFICAGIYGCVSLAKAMAAGFTELHGIDEDEVLVEHAKIIFPKDIYYNSPSGINYAIHLGGATELARIIAQIKKPITFLLSDHFPDMDEIKVNNILQELDVIKKHPIKTHTILIEYIQHVGTPRFGNISLKAIKQKLLEINSGYVFSREKGGHLEREENAVLVAHLIQDTCSHIKKQSEKYRINRK